MSNRNSSAGTAVQKSSKSSLVQRPAIILAMLLLCAVLSTEAQMPKKSTWNPYKFKATDTAYKFYIEVDSFLVQYIHSGSYMSTAVARMICDIDSTATDSAKAANPFAGMKNCREDTAFYNADRHYYSRIQVYAVLNGKRKPIGKEQYGYYVPHGCYEDVPENWVATAKKQSVSDK